MSYLKYAGEKAALLASGTAVVFATDAPPPRYYNPTLSSDALSFTIYPTASAHLAANDMLWQLVQTRTFSASALSTILPSASSSAVPFALALPSPLSRFLSAVTLPEMRAAVIYMLADAAQGEDAEGLAKMRTEIPLSVWRRLTALMEQTAAQRTDGLDVEEGAPIGITRASFLLDAALQTAPSNDYWKISVDVAFAEPMMLGTVLLKEAAPYRRELGRKCTRYLLQRHANVLDEHGIDSLPKRAYVLQSLYEDWRRYSALCDGCTGFHDGRSAKCRGNVSFQEPRHGHALLLLTQLVGSNRQEQTWERVDMVRSCAKEKSSFLSWLPCQIVEQILVPNVVMQDGQDAEEALCKGEREKQNATCSVPQQESTEVLGPPDGLGM